MTIKPQVLTPTQVGASLDFHKTAWLRIARKKLVQAKKLSQVLPTHVITYMCKPKLHINIS